MTPTPAAPTPPHAPTPVERSLVERTLTAVWRAEGARVVAAALRLTRDLGLAEELAQDAVLAALDHWPAEGLPRNPAAWLTTVTQRRALDLLRERTLHARKHEELGLDADALEAHVVPDFVDGLDAARADDIGDDLLRLIFATCHPVLNLDARVALALRLLGGLTTDEIARACLVAEPTVAQRIVRAKRTLAQAQVPFELPPPGPHRHERLDAVLEVVYLIFNEGHAATAGDDPIRPALCDEALRLARLLAGLLPGEVEVLGLQALLELQASRLPARRDAQGRPIRLPEQDRRRWDRLLIRRGLTALDHARALASDPAGEQAFGPYALQAEIAACHARAPRAAATDWPQVVALYDALLQVQPSPVVALNRAVAVAQVSGPAAALALVDALAAEPALRDYPWLPAVQGELLAQLGRVDAARTAFERAAGLTRNGAEREALLARARG